jgi:hypothetical protein
MRRFAISASRPDRLLAQAFARFGGGVEKGQFDLVALALLAQQGVEAEQQFEHRAAAHRGGFVRVAAEAERDASAAHCIDPVADGFRRGDAFAQGQRMFDAGQFLDEAAAGGDDQASF